MENWFESVYSDGTAQFVSPQNPQMGDVVTVSLRMTPNAPVKHVLLRYMPNGEDRTVEMKKTRIRQGLQYYSCTVPMREQELRYQFYLVCEDRMYFYTQRGITAYLPGITYDFRIESRYHQPEWVKKAVFYQIFPERFCNGNPDNDVRSGEYTLDGCPTIARENWESPVLSYAQGHCLDFHGGDLEGIRQKIPYLKKLGVTAVYVNPIFQAPSTHKYDCIDYFHVDEHFGGDEALAELTKALHENGMKLIVDISINHTGTAHKWFNKDSLFFPSTQGGYQNPESQERNYYFWYDNNEYHGWLGNQSLPTLNYTSQALRDDIYRKPDSVLRKWLRPPYSIDGWRFDVADVFGRKDDVQLDKELWPEICAAIREENKDAYILAEDWGDCSEHLQGDQWDSPMNYFGCARVIRQFVGQPDLFLARNPLTRFSFPLSGGDVENRVMEHLAKLPHALWETQFNLIDSHDISRLHNDEKVHPEEYRGAVIFQFLLPGAASIYYGDEAEIDGSLASTEDCRYPMPWSKDIESTESYRLHHTLCTWKAEHPALSQGGMKFICTDGRVFAIARFWGDDLVVGVISGEKEDRVIRLPLPAVGAREPMEKTDVFGKPLTWSRMEDGSIALTVKAHTAYFFPCRPMEDEK